MNKLCLIIKDMVKPNFLNIRTSIQTYDRDALCCGAPCWRWVYHALHSADKWFINPCIYSEPPFHEEGMDNPDNPASITLSDGQLLDYLDQIEQKTYDYLDSLTDEMLYECPENCEHTTHLWIVNRNQPAANHGLERKTIIWHTDCFST